MLKRERKRLERRAFLFRLASAIEQAETWSVELAKRRRWQVVSVRPLVRLDAMLTPADLSLFSSSANPLEQAHSSSFSKTWNSVESSIWTWGGRSDALHRSELGEGNETRRVALEIKPKPSLVKKKDQRPQKKRAGRWREGCISTEINSAAIVTDRSIGNDEYESSLAIQSEGGIVWWEPQEWRPSWRKQSTERFHCRDEWPKMHYWLVAKSCAPHSVQTVPTVTAFMENLRPIAWDLPSGTAKQGGGSAVNSPLWLTRGPLETVENKKSRVSKRKSSDRSSSHRQPPRVISHVTARSHHWPAASHWLAFGWAGLGWAVPDDESSSRDHLAARRWITTQGTRSCRIFTTEPPKVSRTAMKRTGPTEGILMASSRMSRSAPQPMVDRRGRVVYFQSVTSPYEIRSSCVLSLSWLPIPWNVSTPSSACLSRLSNRCYLLGMLMAGGFEFIQNP